MWHRSITVRVAAFAAAVFAIIAVVTAVIGVRLLRAELVDELDRGNVNRITELTLQTELGSDEPFVAVESSSTAAAILDENGFIISATDDFDDDQILDLYLDNDDGEPFDVSFDLSTIDGGESMRGVVLTAVPFDDALGGSSSDGVSGGFGDDTGGEFFDDEVATTDGFDDAFDDEVATTDGFDDVSYAVFLATSTASLDRTVSLVTRAVVIAIPLLTLVVGVLVWAMARRSLRSVERLRRDVESFGGDDLGRRLPDPDVDDELGRLASTMNGMLERIDQATDRQRRFASDASHELRSPLASMSAQLDVDLAHPDHADWPSTAARLRDETARMQHLVDDLLLLARSGSDSATSGTARPVAVDDLLVDAVATAPSRADVTVRATRADRCDLPVDETSLRRIVDNLLANAVRHAAADVEASVERQDGTVVILVDDDGPGIPPDDRARVFDRFVRLDDARSRDDGGSGLGLAICRELTDALGGTITVGDAPIGGARFSLVLPTPH